ncbi:MAG: cytochrome c biogenesis heme-transporting ATPase CcmA [Gammaproteobacteria bacterium]|jgi:heme exporter protein A
MSPDTPALAAQDLTCIRNDRTLFSGLSFQLRASEALLLEGRNGSGKTSLLHILCGTRRPEEGRVSWGEEDIGELGSQYHAAMAYLGHKDGIKLDLTLMENLSVAKSLGNSDASTAPAEALAELELSGYEDIPARHLSAGQRRRVALSRLLLTRAPLWILDEPFTSLDRHGIRIVETLVKRHLSNGGMLAMTSHHAVDFAPHTAQRINLSP